MAAINLRNVDAELRARLKYEASVMGIGLEAYCVQILERRSSLLIETSDSALEVGNAEKSGVEKKNRDVSGAPPEGRDKAPDLPVIVIKHPAMGVSTESPVDVYPGKAPVCLNCGLPRSGHVGENLNCNNSLDPLFVYIPNKISGEITFPSFGKYLVEHVSSEGWAAGEVRELKASPPAIDVSEVPKLAARYNNELFKQFGSELTEKLGAVASNSGSAIVPTGVKVPEDTFAFLKYLEAEQERLCGSTAKMIVEQEAQEQGIAPGTQHFASPNPGPHLLRDKDGNTAYCRPDGCKFCAEGLPPTGDHQSVEAEIDIRDYAAVSFTQEMTIEEAKKRFPAMTRTITGITVTDDGRSPEIRSELHPAKEDHETSHHSGSQVPQGTEGQTSQDLQQSHPESGKAPARVRMAKRRTRTEKNPQAETLNLVQSKEDVTKAVAAMGRPHDKAACRNKYCLICHPEKGE